MSFPTWDFANIKLTTRQISGQLSPNQLTDERLAFYINNYYAYDLPRELKLDEQYVQYQFPLLPGVTTYDLPSIYTHIEAPVYINGIDTTYTESTAVFYDEIPNLINEQTLGITDGVSVNYNFTLSITPVQSGVANSVLITDSIYVFTDDGAGNLTVVDFVGIGTGTVDYTTGAVVLNYVAPPVQGLQVTATYNYITQGWPTSTLFYARQFIFYPAPDNNIPYQARVDAYQQSVVFVNGDSSTLAAFFSNADDTPMKLEWGEMIACGASLKILRDFGQMDKYADAQIAYEKERSKVMSDTDNQYMNVRAMPRF